MKAKIEGRKGAKGEGSFWIGQSLFHPDSETAIKSQFLEHPTSPPRATDPSNLDENTGPRLPPDVPFNVFEELHYKTYLAAMCRVSKQFEDTRNQILCRYVVSTPDVVAAFTEELMPCDNIEFRRQMSPHTKLILPQKTSLAVGDESAGDAEKSLLPDVSHGP